MGHGARHHASGWIAGMALAAVLALGSGLMPLADAADASRVPTPTLDAPQGDKCVADPDFMRRNHMKLLLHQRDVTMHTGVRPRDTALEGCIACHASRQTQSVVGTDQNFCQGCHAYAAVKIDCFECHASKRETAAAPRRGALAGAGP
jgi:hypothetical protein